MQTTYTKEQTDFADTIEDQVSPTLARWVRGQFELGRTLDDVEAQLNRAIAVVANFRT